jgi:hypothetical protein
VQQIAETLRMVYGVLDFVKDSGRSCVYELLSLGKQVIKCNIITDSS